MEGDEEIYAEHVAMLMAIATILVGPDDAPDVVADAFVRALSSPRWRFVRCPPAYLTRIVQNEARRFSTRERRRTEREERVATRVAERVPDSEVDPAVLEAVRDLSPRQQAAVLLTYWSDLAPADVAARLGISEGVVKRHLARARVHLRKVLHER